MLGAIFVPDYWPFQAMNAATIEANRGGDDSCGS